MSLKSIRANRMKGDTYMAQVVDPVCGMTVDSQQAQASEYQGHTYYFCSPGCKKAFEKDPAHYVQQQPEGHSGHHH